MLASMVTLVKSKPQLLAAGFLGYILIGALQAMYGPAFPFFRENYAVSLSAVGLIISAHSIGAVLTIIASGFLLERLGYRRLLLATTAALLAGSVGLSLGNSWGWMLASAFVAGTGFGGLDVTMNLLFAQSFGRHAVAALNMLHAMFGVGAMLGPLLLAISLPLNLGVRPAFALLSLVMLLLCWQLYQLRLPDVPASPPLVSSGQQWGLLIYFIGLYFVYVGAEIGVGSWAATHLAPHYGEARAASVSALYWASFTLGRLLAVPISLRFSARSLVLVSALLSLLSLLLCQSLAAAPYGYMLTGMFFGPIFPTALVWLREVFQARAAKVTSLVIGFANFATIFFPPLVGVAIENSSLQAIPVVLSLITAVFCAFVLLLWWRTAPARSASPA